jgi:YVTN family beta-propeller protein
MGITLRRLNGWRQLAGPAREQDIMKPPRRSVIVVTATIAAIGPASATATALASVPRRGHVEAVKAHVRVTATIPVGRFPVGVAVNPRTDTIYVANANNGTVSVISGRRNTVVATIRVGRVPGAVAVNPRTDTIYVTNERGAGTVQVISGQTNTVVGTVRVGRVPAGVAVNPRTDTIYVANVNSGTVSVISGRTNTVTATIHLAGRFPVGVAVNPRTNTIYVTRAGNIVTHGRVSVISGRTNAVTATVRVGNAANGVATNPKTKRFYVTNAASKTVSVISGRTNMVVATVPVGYPAAFGVAANPRTNTIYVANGDDETVVINGRTNTVAARVRTGNCSVGVAADPRTDTSFVTNACSNTVSVLAACRGRADSRSTPRCRRDEPQAGTRPGPIAWPRSLSQIAAKSVQAAPNDGSGALLEFGVLVTQSEPKRSAPLNVIAESARCLSWPGVAVAMTTRPASRHTRHNYALACHPDSSRGSGDTALADQPRHWFPGRRLGGDGYRFHALIVPGSARGTTTIRQGCHCHHCDQPPQFPG